MTHATEEVDPLRFRVAQLTAETYYGWSHDMEVMLRGKGLRKFVENTTGSQQFKSSTEQAFQPKGNQTGDVELSEADAQKRDLALAYIVTSVDQSCKAIVRQLRCPKVALKTQRATFQFVCEASVDAKLS